MNHRHSTGVARRHLFWAALLSAPTLVAAKGCGDKDAPSVNSASLGVQCSSSAECAAGMFCSFALDADCGAGGHEGNCTPIPAACTQDFNEVCGCDGKTYANTCTANAASASVASRGECAAVGQTCGGALGTACAAGLFCDFALDVECGEGDQGGTCEATPDACTLEINRVCGCDGKTYDNECAARAAGVSVASPAACPALGEPCSAVGPGCGPGRFCQFTIADGCGNDPGVCAVIPETCTREYVPVCACDRSSYDSECLAHSAGVSVAGPGRCP